MRHKRWFQSEEVNMTPLLDVLFSILFIVMLSGARVQSQNTENQQDLNSQIEQLQNELDGIKNKKETEEQFYEDVFLVTIDNITEENQRKLRLQCDKTAKQPEIVSLNPNDTDRLFRIIREYFDGILVDNKSSPVYVVFTCNEKNIYTVEFNSIDSIMKKYESDSAYKLFYKVIYVGGNKNEEAK